MSVCHRGLYIVLYAVALLFLFAYAILVTLVSNPRTVIGWVTAGTVLVLGTQ